MAGRQEDRAGSKSKADRLAEALRANLSRRKAQARARRDQASPGAGRDSAFAERAPDGNGDDRSED